MNYGETQMRALEKITCSLRFTLAMEKQQNVKLRWCDVMWCDVTWKWSRSEEPASIFPPPQGCQLSLREVSKSRSGKRAECLSSIAFRAIGFLIHGKKTCEWNSHQWDLRKKSFPSPEGETSQNSGDDHLAPLPTLVTLHISGNNRGPWCFSN